MRTPQQLWHATLEGWRFKYGPKLADAICSLSTMRAKARLSRTGRIAVLVDNTVLSHGITHETAWVSTGVKQSGPHQIDTGYCARIPVHSKCDTSREYHNIKYLPGIAHLARAGYLTLTTSAELSEERFRQPIGRFLGYGYFDQNVFDGVTIKSVDGSVDQVIGPKYLNLPTSVDQQRARLAGSNDLLYLGLVALLGKNNTQDAWHIRTAELHDQFCFLTMDFSLCENVNSHRDQEPIRSLRTKIMTPLQFGKFLGLLPIHPSLLSYADASYHVRPDLYWPDGKRQRPKRTPADQTLSSRGPS